MSESARFVETVDDPREAADVEFPRRAPKLPPRGAAALERPAPPPPWKPPPWKPPPCWAKAEPGTQVNPITAITTNKSLRKVDFVICLSSQNYLNCSGRLILRAIRRLDLSPRERGTNAGCPARFAHRDSALQTDPNARSAGIGAISLKGRPSPGLIYSGPPSEAARDSERSTFKETREESENGWLRSHPRGVHLQAVGYIDENARSEANEDF
jgi:hypothetical protein